MNIPDPNLFKALSVVRDNTSRRNIRLSYHGTVAKRLGVDLAIMAFARLFSENPDMKFYIIGDGEELAEYMALSENLGLDKAIRFSGKKLPLESLPGILMDIDIGIVSNRKNSATELMLPVKMLEYVALGIPVVAPKLKTIERYFSDEMVRYFEPEDIDSLARAISDLCRDGTKRKIQAEKAKAFLDQYGWEKNASDLIRLYK
jgi:glycosyltransferase involved in cell wall biosynthesis